MYCNGAGQLSVSWTHLKLSACGLFNSQQTDNFCLEKVLRRRFFTRICISAAVKAAPFPPLVSVLMWVFLTKVQVTNSPLEKIVLYSTCMDFIQIGVKCLPCKLIQRRRGGMAHLKISQKRFNQASRLISIYNVLSGISVFCRKIQH